MKQKIMIVGAMDICLSEFSRIRELDVDVEFVNVRDIPTENETIYPIVPPLVVKNINNFRTPPTRAERRRVERNKHKTNHHSR